MLDEALAVLMRAPHSYTGEDVLELHCHGSPVILRQALEAALRHGARLAAPGEFTKRAFLNGKLDLAQAEAVMDLVRARTAEGAGVATDQLRGRLSRHIDRLRERLIRVKGLLEVQIDFSEEDVTVDRAGLRSEIELLSNEVDDLLATYERGRLLRQGLGVAIVGKPNAGKSSLLNALLGEERAIVASMPGTTRDVIEESADFCGVPVVLSDTAGLREARNEVERIGVARALQAARSADIVLLVVDCSAPPPLAEDGLEPARTVIAFNKSDLPCAWPASALDRVSAQFRVVRTSAKEHIGLDELRAAVVSCAGGISSDGTPALSKPRQVEAMGKARSSLAQALRGLEQSMPPDLIAVDVQAALDYIGSVTGVVTSEDVLDAIFSEFCIGK